MYRETGGRRPFKSLIYKLKTDLLLSRVNIKVEVQTIQQSLKEKSQTIKNPKTRHSPEAQVQQTKNTGTKVPIHKSTKNRKGKGKGKALRLLYRRKGRSTGETNQGRANNHSGGKRNRNRKYTCNREKIHT